MFSSEPHGGGGHNLMAFVRESPLSASIHRLSQNCWPVANGTIGDMNHTVLTATSDASRSKGRPRGDVERMCDPLRFASRRKSFPAERTCFHIHPRLDPHNPAHNPVSGTGGPAPAARHFAMCGGADFQTSRGVFVVESENDS